MSYLVKYLKTTGEVIGYTTYKDGDSAEESTEFGYAVVSAAPSGICWIEGQTIRAAPKKPSESHAWDWQQKRYVFDANKGAEFIQALVRDSLAMIDNEAGNTRLRYITSVPGQSETYQRKEQQAREWKAAGYAGTPPVFVATEAEVLGQDPVDVANYIIETADQWANLKGPQIEATRRKWKVAIEQAGTSEAAIRGARDAGIAELMAL